jgi:hypothetical protein
VNGRGFTTPASPSREIFNGTIRLTQQGYNRTERQREVARDDLLRNNNCAVVGKALQTWDSYQSLLEWWREQDDPDDGGGGSKPTPPSTDKSGVFPLVVAHTEGYRLTVDDDTNRAQARISPNPYKKVTGHLRGEPDVMCELRETLTSDEVDVGQAELLSRDGVYSLHVTVTREFDVPEPDTAETVGGVDINERNVSLPLPTVKRCGRRARSSLTTDNSSRNANATTLSRNGVRNTARRVFIGNSVTRKNDSPSGYCIDSPVLSWNSQTSSRTRSSCSRI